MHSKKNIQKKRSGIILIAIAISIVLYLAGVFSGIYANKIIKEQTEQDIRTLKKETNQDLATIQNYVNFLDTSLKNMQLEQTFAESLTHGQMCNFLSISLNELIQQLGFYWSKLPYRIEEYERSNEISPEYSILKEQYAHLSIRTWLIAKNQYDKCNMNVVHGLYFYSVSCTVCVKQGEQIDILSKKIASAGSSLIMFPIDFNSEQGIVKNLKKYYNINSTPAIIINDKVFQGRLFAADELMNYPKLQGKNGQSS